ncbi:MAG: metallophosphoesterase [Deltaproteobacteria bacterium]|nr:metallophosphoesterase [Deltaproteobacteria bacterium]MCB9788889.1 metallophosphoesterase [Deltaproteobacteria bacterium]
MDPLEALDELHVVSDLHLGGPPGRRIFDQEDALAALIDHVATLPAERRAGLVLNGDIVDFLASEDAAYLVPERAVAMLEEIAAAFPKVFAALAALTRTPDRRLILVIGNHDVELGLEHVQRWFAATLCGDDPAARGRLSFHMDGTGYPCSVGGARVLCVHGNGVDEWNVVDHEALRRVRLHLNRGQARDPWVPNAGTRLVIDVLNALKRDYPWVDLLKPETKLIPRLLMALDPGQLGRLRLFVGAFAGTVRDGGQRVDYLGAEDGAFSPAGSGSTDAMLAELLGTEGAPTTDPARLLEEAERDFAAGRDAVDLARAEGGEATLGFGQLLWDRLRGVPPREALRKALVDWLGKDETFALGTLDDTCKRLDSAVGAGVDFLIAGHTHLARAIKRRRGFYYNSGTWIRLIDLGKGLLDSEERFAPAFDVLTAKRASLAQLDAVPGLITRRPTVVRLRAEPDGVHGDLCLVTAADGRATLTPLEGSHFTREASR